MTAPLCTNLSDTLLRLGAEETLHDLLGHLQPVMLETARLSYRCDCSRERVERALISAGKDALEEMAQDEVTEVKCNFCPAVYRFSSEEIKKLLRDARQKRD